MNETVAKRCLQGVLGGKAKRYTEDIQGRQSQKILSLQKPKSFFIAF